MTAERISGGAPRFAGLDFFRGLAVQDRGFARLRALIPDPYAAFAYALIALAIALAALMPFHHRGWHLQL